MSGTPEAINSMIESLKSDLKSHKYLLSRDILGIEERKVKIMSLEQSIAFLEGKRNEHHS